MSAFRNLTRPALFLCAALIAGFALPVVPAHAAASEVVVSDAWVRPSAAKTGAAYLTLTNKGAQADALTSVASAAAEKVQIHSMEMDGTIMRMRRLDALPLPAGEAVQLAPGGLHIMLIGLTAPLKVGDTVELKLSFEKSGPLDIRVPVQSVAPAAAKAPARDMPGMSGAGNHP